MRNDRELSSFFEYVRRAAEVLHAREVPPVTRSEVVFTTLSEPEVIVFIVGPSRMAARVPDPPLEECLAQGRRASRVGAVRKDLRMDPHGQRIRAKIRARDRADRRLVFT